MECGKKEYYEMLEAHAKTIMDHETAYYLYHYNDLKKQIHGIIKMLHIIRIQAKCAKHAIT